MKLHSRVNLYDIPSGRSFALTCANVMYTVQNIFLWCTVLILIH